ncbi:uncharacterized protein LOC109136544 [Beta vulgaris subsp. vulgaris]|uniref:uncharacterized protein LOC109136544 n=1 Tax=Beta vulgaris subsp. vulgaris TaxID=3555 RepID=UPI00090071AE|nr:uncharacterized protein LOC109136544 [Beta vulgaris subsp. vulgaris]
MNRNEAERSANVVSGTFSMNFALVKVLFDFVATYSFISSSVIESTGLVDFEVIDLPISIPTREVRCTKLFKDLPMKIGDSIFPSDLIEFNLGYLDVIHGMNWLDFYKGKIDCEAEKVVLKSSLGNLTSYRQFGKPKNFVVISAMQVKILMKKGCELFFCSVQDIGKEVRLKIEDVPIVNKFMDVIPSEISSMPPARTIEFTVDLVPGTTPISEAPYRMETPEMSELKTRLQELLDQGYIRPNKSPWGAPVLFVKNKDGRMRLCIDNRERV